jgi:hypothetical protein
MLKLHEFYRRFDQLPRERRFELIEQQQEPTSLFVIFQQLTQVRAQKKYFEDREEHLLAVAEAALNKKQNGAI